jgi:hypothetical protein
MNTLTICSWCKGECNKLNQKCDEFNDDSDETLCCHCNTASTEEWLHNSNYKSLFCKECTVRPIRCKDCESVKCEFLDIYGLADENGIYCCNCYDTRGPMEEEIKCDNCKSEKCPQCFHPMEQSDDDTFKRFANILICPNCAFSKELTSKINIKRIKSNRTRWVYL